MDYTFILYIIPSIVSLFCAGFFAMKKRVQRQTVFMVIELLSVFYYAEYALYTHPNTDYELMIRLDSWCITTILAMLALILAYLHMHYTKKAFRTEYCILFFPALLLGSVNGILYYILGYEKATEITRNYDLTGTLPDGEIYRLYNLFSEILVNATAFVFSIAILALCIKIIVANGYKPGDIYRFFFKSKPLANSTIIATLYIVMVGIFSPMVVLGRVYMMAHFYVGIACIILLSLVKFIIFYVENYSEVYATLTLHDLFNVDDAESSNVIINNEESPSPPVIQTSASHSTRFIDLAHDRLQYLLDVEEIYKDPDLTLSTLSEKMSIGRTTLSAMIKLYYGIPFRELVNKHRIETAKKYMLQNPEATQETIAQICGFKNGNYLNTKFKEIVGETPMMWLAKQHK